MEQRVELNWKNSYLRADRAETVAEAIENMLDEANYIENKNILSCNNWNGLRSNAFCLAAALFFEHGIYRKSPSEDGEDAKWIDYWS